MEIRYVFFSTFCVVAIFDSFFICSSEEEGKSPYFGWTTTSLHFSKHYYLYLYLSSAIRICIHIPIQSIHNKYHFLTYPFFHMSTNRVRIFQWKITTAWVKHETFYIYCCACSSRFILAIIIEWKNVFLRQKPYKDSQILSFKFCPSVQEKNDNRHFIIFSNDLYLWHHFYF